LGLNAHQCDSAAEETNYTNAQPAPLPCAAAALPEFEHRVSSVGVLVWIAVYHNCDKLQVTVDESYE
jgi:hypothetical protein